jgi:lipopolysaccharide export system permease protein
MRLLDRYLLRELMTPLGYCLGGFFIFWVSFDLFAELASFRDKQLEAAEIVLYYLFKVPEMLVVVLPVALLLGLLYALTTHARHHELTAIRAAGVSLSRMCLPYVAVGLLFSLGLFALNESWAPLGSDAAEQIVNSHGPRGQPKSPTRERTLGFDHEREKRLWYMESFNLITHEVGGPLIEWTLPDGSVRKIYAERAWRQADGWLFTNVHVQVTPPGRGVLSGPWQETNRLIMAEFTETPEDIKCAIKVNKVKNPANLRRATNRLQLSIREILDYERMHPEDTRTRAILDTKLHSRYAAPLTCLVVVLIALPFGAASGRRNVFVGVAASIFICFGYFVLTQFGLALGTRGAIPAWIAAWAPNLVFGVTGVLMSWRIR